MNLWVDDERDPVKFASRKDYVWAKTYEEAIRLLGTGTVDFLSLDHDLGTAKSGYDIISWMEWENIWPRSGVAVHSQNPVGRREMELVIRDIYGRNFRG